MADPALHDGANRYLPGMVRGRVVIGAAVVAVLIAGCTSEAAPAPTDSPSVTATHAPSRTPSVSAAATAPQRPEAMATPSADGAAAAATYFLQLYPYARATGDLAEWQALAADECTFCTSVEAEVTSLIEQGQTVSGGAITVSSADGTEVIANESYSAQLLFMEAPTETWSGTTLVSTGDGGRYEALAVLRWNGQAWEVRAVDLSQPS